MSNQFGTPADQEDEEFFAISLSDEEADASKIPDGEYDAECIDTRFKKGDKGEQIILTWAITTGKFAGKEVPMFLSRSAKTLWKIKETLKNLNLESKVTEREGSQVIKPSIFMKVKAKIVVATFKGDKGEMQTVNKCLPPK